jgi:hypothetical protein
MAKVKNVERQIYTLEKFKVRIRDMNGRALRKNSQIPSYNKPQKMAKHKWTCQAWKDERFSKNYHGYQVDVLKYNGKRARGNMTLATVRDTYLD